MSTKHLYVDEVAKCVQNRMQRIDIKELCVVFGIHCGGVVTEPGTSLIGGDKMIEMEIGGDVLRVHKRGKRFEVSGDLWLWWVGLVVETVLGSDGGGKLGGGDGSGRWT
ncbi:hypothetical protein Tco_0890192 [Tanacetum coccineum]|uniref:Uncharacterized protein n=1 Tax=Tanacetum coccineum TaxID=301880 RepID=A0ABQ5BZS5_9ASTR